MRTLAIPLVVLLGSGVPGQFQVVQQISAAGRPSEVVVIDVNRDGLPDIVALNATHAQVGVWLAQPGGGFSASTPVSTAPNQATDLAVGDLDGDGLLDLVVLGDTGSGSWGIAVSLAGPGGTFSPASIRLAPQRGCCAQLGDLDGDGNLDLAYVTIGACLVVLPGDGAGGFGPEMLQPVWPLPSDLELADLDGDGNLDVAAAIGNANAIQVLWGDGTGGFPTTGFASVSGRDPISLVAGDADHDGDTDLLVAARNSSEVDLVTNQGGRNFSEAGRFFTRPSPRDVLFGDLDGDGNGDLAVMHGFSPVQFAFLRGDGAGGFSMRQWLALPGSDEGHGTIADLDVDGVPEVLIPIDGGDQILVLGDPTAPTPGLSTYGTGTPGCRGGLGITGSSTPAVGNAGFAFLASNAPSETYGLIALGSRQDLGGSDPFGIGALLHVALVGPVLTDPFPSDVSGAAFASAPIAANPTLAGQQFFAQGIWIEERTGQSCSASPLGLVTSLGLQVTIQP